MKSRLIEASLKEYATHEAPGSAANSRVLEYFAASGNGWVKDDTGYAWCSAYMNWVAHQAGLPMTGSLQARSWLKAGQETRTPEIGDVVVFWRDDINGPNGHVSLFIREVGDVVYVLGGNQNDAVNVMAYRKDHVLQYRDITKPWPVAPVRAILKRGMFGDDVKRVQAALRVEADGQFGPVTEKAVTDFQKAHGLKVDGIVGKDTLAALNLK